MTANDGTSVPDGTGPTQICPVLLEYPTDAQRLAMARAGISMPIKMPTEILTAPFVRGLTANGEIVFERSVNTIEGRKYPNEVVFAAVLAGQNPIEALEKLAQEAEAYEARQAEIKALHDRVRASGGDDYSLHDAEHDYAANKPFEQIVAEQRQIVAERIERKREAQAREAEKLAWIAHNGSADLKERVSRGYDCTRKYIEERLAVELPGWIVRKWDNKGKWELRDRTYPSDVALAREDEAAHAGYKATTRWAVWDEDEEETQGEVVVIENYHGYLVYFPTGID